MDNKSNELLNLDCLPSFLTFIKEEPQRLENIMGIPKQLPGNLYMLTKAFYPKGLYAHQFQSIEASLSGKHVAINTSTASGKSTCFIIPTLVELLKDPQARSIFIYPIKALANDQIDKLQDWAGPLRLRNVVQKFDGDVNKEGRLTAIKEGRLLITTPDVLHTTLLRLNKEPLYQDFFRNLKYIVLDECHIYNGVFGSHMAMVIRRLRQVCRNYQNNPQFILSSATIGNPEKSIHNLTGLSEVEIISEKVNGSSSNGKKYFMVKPPNDSTYYAFVTKLIHDLINSTKKFLIFSNTRKEVEQITIFFRQNYPEEKDKIMPYRAGYEIEDRRAIEKSLNKGTLSGVVSTSALEMGIDLPQLDVCMMLGLPGNRISMIQRAGRVGRKSPGTVIIIANNSAYDNYFVNNPHELFDRPLEDLSINLENKQILISHYACAKTESVDVLQPKFDDDIFSSSFLRIVGQINTYDYPEDILYEQTPHYKIMIRSIDDPSYAIILGRRSDDPEIGNINYSNLLKEAYKDGIYLHLGKRYRVNKISYSKRQIFVDARCPVAQTKPKMEIHVKPRISSQVKKSKIWPGIKVWGTSLGVTEKVTGYVETSGKLKQEHYYPQPMMRYFITGGSIISLSGLKQITHAAILGLATALDNAYPILYNCAKEDIRSYAWSRENEEGHIYLFDANAGGLGITDQVVDLVEDLLEVAAQSVLSCPNCQDSSLETSNTGCVKCVLSNMFINYPLNTRIETINLLNEIRNLMNENKPLEQQIIPDSIDVDSVFKPYSEDCFGRNMIANGSLVYTGKHQEGVVLDSKLINNGMIEDRIYTIQVGNKKLQFLGCSLTLIQGKLERWCLNCGQELIDYEEVNCPVCNSKLI